MDQLGVDRALMSRPLAIHVVVHALNEWLYETWQFNHKDRIFTTPVITPAGPSPYGTSRLRRSQ